jgi:hypothetical protein
MHSYGFVAILWQPEIVVAMAPECFIGSVQIVSRHAKCHNACKEYERINRIKEIGRKTEDCERKRES